LSGSLVCGLDVGGTKLLALAFDPESPGRWRVTRRVPTPRSPDDLLATVEALVAEMGSEAARIHSAIQLHAVGLGIAGLVQRDGSVRVGPNLPGIADLALADLLAERLQVPVAVENDATAATWGEHREGAGLGVAEMVMVTLGTGIGAGIVTGGHLLTGVNGFAGEVGHMIIDPDGPLCPCGQRGCWERYASGTGLGRLGREAAEAGLLSAVVEGVGGDPEAVRGDQVTAAALAGDPEALAVLEAFAGWVALGLANLTNILDPEVIVIGGGLVAAGDALLDPVRSAFARTIYAGDRRVLPRIVPAELGASAGAIGAGLLAAERV
jgi:glucokinase